MNLWQTIVTLAAALGAAACLYVMWRTPRGIPGLKAIQPDFQLPDTRLFYTREQLTATLTSVGDAGRGMLIRLWHIDFVFILCVLIVMWGISLNFSVAPWMRDTMLTLAAVRALLDMLENLLLLSVCRHLGVPSRAAAFSGRATALKWVAMAGWVAGLFLGLFLRAFHFV